MQSVIERLAGRVLTAETDHHPDDDAGSRNGYGRKTVMTDSSSFGVEIRSILLDLSLWQRVMEVGNLRVWNFVICKLSSLSRSAAAFPWPQSG